MHILRNYCASLSITCNSGHLDKIRVWSEVLWREGTVHDISEQVLQIRVVCSDGVPVVTTSVHNFQTPLLLFVGIAVVNDATSIDLEAESHPLPVIQVDCFRISVTHQNVVVGLGDAAASTTEQERVLNPRLLVEWRVRVCFSVSPFVGPCCVDIMNRYISVVKSFRLCNG